MLPLPPPGSTRFLLEPTLTDGLLCTVPGPSSIKTKQDTIQFQLVHDLLRKNRPPKYKQEAVNQEDKGNSFDKKRKCAFKIQVRNDLSSIEGKDTPLTGPGNKGRLAFPGQRRAAPSLQGLLGGLLMVFQRPASPPTPPRLDRPRLKHFHIPPSCAE